MANRVKILYKMRAVYLFPLILLSALLLSSCGGAPSAKSTLPPLSADARGELQIVWNREIGDVSSLLRPAISAEMVCAVNEDGEIFILNAVNGDDMSPMFAALEDGVITGGTGCNDDVVAVADENGVLLAFDYAGNALWQHDLQSRVIASPLVRSGSVFALGQDGRLSAYSAQRGELLWRYVSPPPSPLRTPVDSTPVESGAIYMGGGGGEITALEQSSGKVVWEVKLSFVRSADAMAKILDMTAPAVRGGVVCAAGYQGHVGCISADSGEILWRKPFSALRRVALDELGTRLAAVDAAGELTVFDTRSGAVLWGQKLITAKTVAFVRGAVLVGFADGVLAALAADDGRLLSTINTDDEIIFLQAIGIDGALGATLAGGVFRAQFLF